MPPATKGCPLPRSSGGQTKAVRGGCLRSPRVTGAAILCMRIVGQRPMPMPTRLHIGSRRPWRNHPGYCCSDSLIQAAAAGTCLRFGQRPRLNHPGYCCSDSLIQAAAAQTKTLRLFFCGAPPAVSCSQWQLARGCTLCRGRYICSPPP